MKRRLVFLTMVLAMGVPVGFTQSAAHIAKSSLLVVTRGDKSLVVIDPAKRQIVSRIPVGGSPHEVIASDDGTRAYISNDGDDPSNAITVVDLTANKVLKMISLGPLYGPYGLAYAAGHLYFAADRERVIGRVDLATDQVDWVVGIGQTGAHTLWVAPGGNTIYALNTGSGTVSIVQAQDAAQATTDPVAVTWKQDVIEVGILPEGMDVLHDLHQVSDQPVELWVANGEEGDLSEIDLVHLHALYGRIKTFTPSKNHVRFTPNLRMALVTAVRGKQLMSVDASTHFVRKLEIGPGGGDIVVDPDPASNFAFISCSVQNALVIVDLKTLTVAGKIEVGSDPEGATWVSHD